MLPLSCTLYSEAPSAVARMHSPAGSSGQGSAPASIRRRTACAEAAPHVAEVALLAAVDVFADAAGEHDAVDASQLGDRLGEIEMLDRVRQRPRPDGGDERIGHALGHAVHRGGIDDVAALPGEPGLRRMVAAGRIEPHDPAVLVDHLQPAADMHRGGRDHAALLDQAELGGAAADVDVEDALALVVRHARGARAIGREHRLHVVAGGGADEFAALVGQQAGDRLRVLAPQRLAGEDHDAGVDVVGMQARGLVGLIDDGAERRVVDALFALVGRERDRRLEQRLARDHVVAAGEVLAEPAQVEPREDHLRAGRADVDADTRERHMVREPQRVFFERAVRFECVVVMIVVVVGVAVMLVVRGRRHRRGPRACGLPSALA